MKGFAWRTTLFVFTVLFSIYLLVPSYLKLKYDASISKRGKASDPWYYRLLPSEVLKLGLDLKGGLHLVLGIDFNEVYRDASTKLKNQLKEQLEREKVQGVELATTNDFKITATYQNEEIWKKIDKTVFSFFRDTLERGEHTATSATLIMSPDYMLEVKRRAVDQSLETLRNRIDQFGIAEPILQRQGEEKIMVQFPGVQEADRVRLKDIISRTAKLSFQIVKSGPENPNGEPSLSKLQSMVTDFTKAKNITLTDEKPITSYTRDLNAFFADKLPKGTELLFKREVHPNTREAQYIPYLLEKEAMVSGEDLEDAFYGFDQQNGEAEVNFRLNTVGAQKFDRATSENVGKFMAIVLDNNVHSAPRIKERIPSGSARISMDGSKNQAEKLNEAKDTSLVLRSGALPARLEFLEERVVGPSLGQDAIKSGSLSLIAGLSLVFIFMMIYYKGSGAVACVALALNGLLIFAIMAAFEGTLTLPGLAGITLTLGMAVDANVLIFEHMREELRAGKSVNLAIAEGYSRALSAILDSHVTSIIAGVILLNFGYGPIRGFAVTLLIGLIASLYTSVFVTRLIQDYFVVSKGKQTLSV